MGGDDQIQPGDNLWTPGWEIWERQTNHNFQLLKRFIRLACCWKTSYCTRRKKSQCIAFGKATSGCNCDSSWCIQPRTTLQENTPILCQRRMDTNRFAPTFSRGLRPVHLYVTVDETSIPVTLTPTVTWHETLFSLCNVATSSSHPVQGQVWEISASFALYTFCGVLLLARALVPLQSVAIPETVLTSLLLRHYKQLSSVLHTLSSQSYSPAHACALFCVYRAQFWPCWARYTSVTFISWWDYPDHSYCMFSTAWLEHISIPSQFFLGRIEQRSCNCFSCENFRNICFENDLPRATVEIFKIPGKRWEPERAERLTNSMSALVPIICWWFLTILQMSTVFCTFTKQKTCVCCDVHYFSEMFDMLTRCLKPVGKWLGNEPTTPETEAVVRLFSNDVRTFTELFPCQSVFFSSLNNDSPLWSSQLSLRKLKLTPYFTQHWGQSFVRDRLLHNTTLKIVVLAIFPNKNRSNYWWIALVISRLHSANIHFDLQCSTVLVASQIIFTISTTNWK